jgi:hypothetical protein
MAERLDALRSDGQKGDGGGGSCWYIFVSFVNVFVLMLVFV